MLNDINWMLMGAIALLAGCALAAIFFGGLWWTVQRGATSPTPARWFIGSLVLRTSIVLVGFYAVGSGQPLWLGLCLLGFMLARTAILRMSRYLPAVNLSVAPGKPPCA
jgi:F1F0 ATPase subunit 2